MAADKADAVLDLTVVEERARGLADWLKKNGAGCSREQRHLEDGTIERVYWHYGYMVALRDVLRFLTGEPLATQCSHADKNNVSRAA